MSYEIKQKNPSSRSFRVNTLYPEEKRRFMLNFWQLNIFRCSSGKIFWPTSLEWKYFLTQFFKVVFCRKKGFFHTFYSLGKKKKSILGYYQTQKYIDLEMLL